MAKCKPFTAEEIAIIKKHYHEKGAVGVAILLAGRNRDAVKNWAYRNGFKVSKEYRSNVARRVNYIHKRNMSAETRKKIGDGHRKYKPFVCKSCGDKISHYATYCWDCYSMNVSGRDNNNWRGGVAKLISIVSTALLYLWKTPILIRDNYTCQKCGAIGTLEVHHIRRYVTIRDSVIKANPHLSVNSVEGKFELAKLIVTEHKLSDGISLCKKCHKSIHRNKSGELLETPNASGEDNQQPSPLKLRLIVSGKVQRLTGEDLATDNPDTSARHPKCANGVMI